MGHDSDLTEGGKRKLTGANINLIKQQSNESHGLVIKATYNDLAKEESDEEEPANYFAQTSTGSKNKIEDSVTGTIEAKLDFKKFREFR